MYERERVSFTTKDELNISYVIYVQQAVWKLDFTLLVCMQLFKFVERMNSIIVMVIHRTPLLAFNGHSPC